MKYFLVTWYCNKTDFRPDHIAYFYDFALARGYVDSLGAKFYGAHVSKVPYTQYVSDFSDYPYIVSQAVNRCFKNLCRFRTLDQADDFVRYYSSLHPCVKLVTRNYVLPASFMDSQSSLF